MSSLLKSGFRLFSLIGFFFFPLQMGRGFPLNYLTGWPFIHNELKHQVSKLHFAFCNLIHDLCDRKRQAVIPIVIGVALACYGEIDFTLLGFIVTAACVFFAAIKVVVSGYALTGEWKLHPVDLLSRYAFPLFLSFFPVQFFKGRRRVAHLQIY